MLVNLNAESNSKFSRTQATLSVTLNVLLLDRLLRLLRSSESFFLFSSPETLSRENLLLVRSWSHFDSVNRGLRVLSAGLWELRPNILTKRSFNYSSLPCIYWPECTYTKPNARAANPHKTTHSEHGFVPNRSTLHTAHATKWVSYRPASPLISTCRHCSPISTRLQ